MSAHVRIQYRRFACDHGHAFQAARKTVHRQLPDGSSVIDEQFQTSGGAWLPIPKCPEPDCPSIGTELSDLLSGSREFAQVPEAERFQAWLSPDGSKLAPPGYRGAKMPERYRRAGYTVVEAANLHQMSQLESVRARQTGNTVYNEVAHFDAATRAARERAEYSDDLTVDT